MLEVVQVDPFSPTSYCYRCRKLFKKGEQIGTIWMPIPVKHGKQRKKLKGDTRLTFKAHVQC